MDVDETRKILFALELDGRGGARELEQSELAHPGVLPRWIHVNALMMESSEELSSLAPALDSTTAEGLLSREARPRCLQLEDNVQLTLRGVNLNEDSDAEDMVGIRLWIEKNYLVTTRFRRLKTVLDIRQRLLHGNGPKTIGEIVTQVCSRILQHMDPVLSTLDDDTDMIEEQIIETADSSLRKAITDVRKRAILFRRYIAPQREAIGQLRRAETSWLSAKDTRSLQENHDRITRYVEDLDAVRERAQIVKDELANALSDKLNRNLYILSVITAIFLPLGFLTGLFGINVGGMPGVDDARAFFIFLAALIALVAVQVVLFKRLKWF